MDIGPMRTGDRILLNEPPRMTRVLVSASIIVELSKRLYEGLVGVTDQGPLLTPPASAQGMVLSRSHFSNFLDLFSDFQDVNEVQVPPKGIYISFRRV